MLFNTIDFVIFFVIVLTVISIIKARKFQHLFLLLASYFFFYYSSNYLIILLIASTLLDYYLGKEIWNSSDVSRKKILLTISLSGNLGLLGFYKYYDFAISEFNKLGNYLGLENIPLLELALPIGISFYTFQTISYTVDVYRGKLEPCKSLGEFALYVSFFPQLVAGPIVRAKDFLPQLREKLAGSKVGSRLRQIVITESNLKLGVTIMALGFFKKMFFADNIAPFVNEIFNNPIGHESYSIILATIGFGIQIYGDFSGYSDIAIGAALIMGFKLPLNFNKPYFATSPSNFWTRWHISLSSWLRDYFYVPLGGNRKSKGRTYVNLLTVMFFGGLWHGAAVNFIVWGLLHGFYLSLHKLILDRFPRLGDNSFFRSKIGKITAILITQYFIFLTWIPFRVENSDQMFYSMQKYVFFDFQFDGLFEFIFAHKFPLALMFLFFILHFIAYRKKNLPESISKFSYKFWCIFLIIILASIVFFYNGNPEDFIYFRF